MELPASFPNPEKNRQAIESLLERVRQLDPQAKSRLGKILDDEMDLPYLDRMEREYAQVFRQIAPDYAAMLRGRFVTALNEQRELMLALVRDVLQQDPNRQTTVHS